VFECYGDHLHLLLYSRLNFLYLPRFFLAASPFADIELIFVYLELLRFIARVVSDSLLNEQLERKS